MKILQILQKPQLRGAEIFASQLAHELSQKGHQVALLFLFPGSDELPFKGLKIYLHADPSKRFWDLVSYRRLAKIIRDFQPDIVQANAGDTLKYAAISRLLFRWKPALIFRNANQISGFVNSLFKRKYNQILLTQVDAVASVSQICKDDFNSVFDWKKIISVLPIGTIIPDNIKDLPSDISVKLEENPFLIHLGSFVPEKNHEGLLRIFKNLLIQIPNLRLVLCGDGPLRHEVESQLPENVLVLGLRTDVSSIIPHAKALLLPSLVEGLPGVILEAMAMRVPVVAYAVGGIPEVIHPGKTGFLIPKREEELFAEVLNNQVLKLSQEDLQLILNQASNLVADQFSLPAVSNQFESFYFSLINPIHAHTDS